MQSSAPADAPAARLSLDRMSIYAITWRQGQRRFELATSDGLPPGIHDTTDLITNWWQAVTEAFGTLYHKPTVVRIVGDDALEIAVNGTRLRVDMVSISFYLSVLSLAIVLVSALAVYLAMRLLLVRRMRDAVAALEALRAQPGESQHTVAALGRVCKDLQGLV